MDKSELLGYVLAEKLFTKTASPGIPGLIQGTQERRCGRCHFFQMPRSALQMFDEGVDVVGTCNAWSAHCSANKQCPRFTEGEPHAY